MLMVMEVQQGNKLYIFVNELLRWRGLLDNKYKQVQLNTKRIKISHSY